MNTHPSVSVLTGDLIQSRTASKAAVDQAFTALQTAAEQFGKGWDIDLRFTRYRGDGWQVLLCKPGLTLHALIFLRARLRAADAGIDTRIAAGIGALGTAGTRDLSDASGAAFVASGHALDAMSPKRQLTITGTGVTDELAALIDLTEFISMGWTAAQAEAVAHALDQNAPTHDEIAKTLGITRQAVQSRLAGAGFSYFHSALYAMQHHDFMTTQPTDD